MSETQNMQRITPASLILFLLMAFHAPVSAGMGEWDASITISTPYADVAGGVVTNALTAGVRHGSASGYDNATDTVSFIEPDDPLLAYFPHGATLSNDPKSDGSPTWTCPAPDPGYNLYQCSLWRDFRPLTDMETWIIEVISTLNGTTISLAWVLSGNPSDPTAQANLDDLAYQDLMLVDLSATPPAPPVDLKSLSQYHYTNVFLPGKKYGLRRFQIQSKTAGLIVSPPMLPSGTVNTLYSDTIRLIGGNAMWSLVDGALPPGLQLDSSSGLIDGIPLQEGAYEFTIRADDLIKGSSLSHTYTVGIHPPLYITTADLPGGEMNDSYAETMEVSGGSPPYAWHLAAGSLPEGLRLDPSDGTITGIFEIPGIFDFTLQVHNALGATAVHPYRIVVTEPTDLLAPHAIVDLAVLYTIDQTAILSWTAPWDDSLTQTAAIYDLRYSPACPSSGDTAWWDMALQAAGEPRPQRGALHIYTLSTLQPGVRYCAAMKSLDASGHASAISNGVSFLEEPSTGIGTGETLSSFQLPLMKGYNLIAFPVHLIPNDLSIFEDTLGSPVALSRWFAPYPGQTPPDWYLEDHTQPGYAYFIHVADTGRVVPIQGLQNRNATTTVPLQGGWNMVGNPYASDLLLSDVQLRSFNSDGSSEVLPYEKAARLGWVGNALYAFTGLGYEFMAINDETAPAVLKPWIGYWLYVQENKNYEMIFRKPS